MKTEAHARALGERQPFARAIVTRLARLEDGNILRFAFFALLAGTLGVLYVDYRELSANQADAPMISRPILPPASVPNGEEGRPRPEVTTAPERLEAPLEIVLGGGGALQLTGTIDPGSAQRFAAEIVARGEYVRQIVLNSPGGSVDDALAIGRLVRENQLATKVGAGQLCASSCPLIFAAGETRLAGPASAIGVHQIYASVLSDGPVDALSVAGIAMADAQLATAEITRFLTEMGVDPALWLHALDTPPDRLYYFTLEEMEQFKLVTEPITE